jgi:hypothetical protein
VILRTALVLRVAILVALVAPASVARGQDAARFDLVCQGATAGAIHGAPSPTTLRLRVDLDQKRFCLEAFCDVLQVNGATLEFHCQDKGGQACKLRSLSNDGRLLSYSTAGPFVRKEDIIIDRPTGVILRDVSGMHGDIVSQPFSTAFSGLCATAPFTGLEPPARP